MKKGLFKKILVVMMCIALTLGMAACGSKKVKVGTGENQSSEDTVKGSKSADDLVKAVAANKKGLENFTVSFDAKLDADLDLKQVLIMQGMTEEMIESAIKEGELEESDLKSSAKAGINGTLKICDEAGYAEGKSYAKIPDVAEDSQELKTYLVKEGNTAYVYEYDFDDEKWMKEESDTNPSDVIASLRSVTAITDFIKTADVVSEKNGIYTVEAKLDFDKILGDKEDDIKSAIENSLSGLGSVSEEDFDISKIIDLLEDVAITVTIDGDNDTITAISIDLKSCIGKILEVSSTEDVNVKDLLSINEASVTFEFSDFGKTKVELPDEIKDADDSDDKKDEEESTPDKPAAQPTTPASNVSAGESNALKSAKSYLDMGGFSKESLKGQLEYEGYDANQIQYALDNCGADWKKQALMSAKSYLESNMGFSKLGLTEQLEYEEFTSDEVRYAIDNCGGDWMAQAVIKAQSYMESVPMSRDELISQLEYEKFTHEEAVHGVDAVGL